MIGILGIAACALGTPDSSPGTRFLAVVGVLALALFVWAIVSASLTPLSLLVVAIVVLWIGSTARHAGLPHHPTTA